MVQMEAEVLKFGGAAVATPQQIKKVACFIAERRTANSRIIVVVSAMGKTTDELLFLANAVNSSPPKREQDMLISVGERISISLLAMALSEKGVEAISFTGSQSGIITSNNHSEAKIVSVRPHRLIAALDQEKVAIVAGFQGVSVNGEITTLGRGGSDTSAVALAVAIGAPQVEFFKDVPGIYSHDPKIDAKATCFETLTYEEAIAIVREGNGVVHQRAIHLAEKNGISLKVTSFSAPDTPGTLVSSLVEPPSIPVYEESSPSGLVEAADERLSRRIESTLLRAIEERSLPVEALAGAFPIFHSERRENLFILTLASRHLPHVARFFYDMLSHWLLPGHQIEIPTFLSTLFHLAEFGEQNFAFQELHLSCRTPREAEVVAQNLGLLEKEITLGASSFYHASKILEMKGLSLDDKTAIIQQRIAHLVQRFTRQFDYDIFGEMQHFFASSKETFKTARDTRHVCELIYTLYFFRKKLEGYLARSETKRHVLFKLKKNVLHTPFGMKEILSVYLGISFLKEHEIFEERHLLSALAHFIPEIKSIPDSFYIHDVREENLGLLYLEIEKESGFSKLEIERLSKLLPDEIRSRVEQLVPPIFMPRNEEDVMRGILTLSRQLHYARDIPQMIISFDEQTDVELVFTVIIVRLQYPDSIPIRELFEKSLLASNLSFDRIKQVGMLRRKTPKEAAVLRVRLPVESFYRGDFSVDLSAARSSLASAIHEVVGDVRDFNGGMIAKQNENFIQMKKLLEEATLKHSLLLQNFFHAIYPAPLSATLAPELLKTFFLMLLEVTETARESITLQSKKERDHLFVMIKFHDLGWKHKIFHQIEALSIPSNQVASMQIQIFDAFYLGFIYLSGDKEKQQAFLEAIPEALVCHTVT
ncbi:MAG: Aspartokinase [Chlamydiae bacterium]|nr:Aspartokinase [Chlamydiota bacterium]